MPKFENVSCSQCGASFGPGDSGFSHCDQHTKPDPWKDVPAQYKRERWSVDSRDDGMFFVHSGGYGICEAEDSEVCFAIAAAFNATHFNR